MNTCVCRTTDLGGERIADLYGDVVFYYGKPTQSQLDPLQSLQLQFQSAQTTFSEIIQSLPDIKTISRNEWDNQK